MLTLVGQAEQYMRQASQVNIRVAVKQAWTCICNGEYTSAQICTWTRYKKNLGHKKILQERRGIQHDTVKVDTVTSGLRETVNMTMPCTKSAWTTTTKASFDKTSSP